MMTSAILNPASIPATPVPTAKQNAGSASTPPFGVVLSRELAGRGSPDADSQASSTESRPAAVPGQPPADPAAATSAAGQSGPASDRDRDEIDDSDAAAATATAQLLLLVTHLAGVDAIAAEPATAIAATAAVAKKTATAAATLPLKSGQAQSAGDVMDSLADPAAAAALAEQKPAASLPANATATATAIAVAVAAASAAASEVKQPPGLTEARGPSAQESGSGRVRSAATGPERRAAAQPIQPALSSTAPALAGPGASPPAMQAEPMATAPPVSALGGVTRAPEMQADLSVVGPPALQPAAFNNVLAATAPAADKLTPQVGTSGWDQAVGQKVVWMAAGAQSSASLTLNPPDLGPLQVALTIVNNQASVSFTAAQPEVRQALEAALPKLREMLGDAGIQMGQASVNAGVPQQHGGHGESRQASRGVDPAAAATDAPLSVTDSHAAGGRQGLIDTFA